MRQRNPSRPEKPRSHEEWQVLVSAYSDGEVTPEEQALVESHLAECAECSAMLAGYGRLSKTIHALPQGAPSRTLVQHVRERVSRPRLPLWRRLAPLVSTAALLLVALTAWYITYGLQGPSSKSNGTGGRDAAGLQQESAPAAATVPELKSGAGQPTAEGMLQNQGQPEDTAPVPAMQALGAGAVTTATCPGQVLAYDVTSLSVRTDDSLAAPRLVGTLLDAADQPLPNTTVVVSSTTGWQATTVTDGQGAFRLDLPEPGQYRVALAMEPPVVLYLASTTSPTRAAAYDSYHGEYYESVPDLERGRVLAYLPDIGLCLAPADLTMAPVSLGAHDEVVVVLRVRE